MDYDADGIPDLVSGCYDPGEVYLFRGKGKGEYAARETIKDKAGKPVVRVPNQKDKIESFGSWLALVDWDGDGDLDILLGGFDGAMVVRLNEGTRAKPEYAPENTVPTTTDGKPLRVPEHHANPVVADWDGDGKWDVVSGCSDGGVYWFKNVGGPGKPALEPAAVLVPPHKGIGYSEFLDAGEEPRPGVRAQIGVADLNGDGKLDLLVGDFCTYVTARADLNPAERQEMLALRKRLAELGPPMEAESKALRKKLGEEFKDLKPDEWRKDETQKRYRKRQEELYATEPMKGMAAEYKTVDDKLKPFLAKPAGRAAVGDDLASPRGYVWLYVRK